VPSFLWTVRRIRSSRILPGRRAQIAIRFWVVISASGVGINDRIVELRETGSSRLGKALGKRVRSLKDSTYPIEIPSAEDHHPWYRQASPLGGPAFFSPFLMNLHFDLIATRYLIQRGVHAKMQWQTFCACEPTSTFACTWRVLDKYEKRGGRYFVTETEFRWETGELAAKVINHTLLNPDDLFQAKGER
jgi:hypothetical protein